MSPSFTICWARRKSTKSSRRSSRRRISIPSLSGIQSNEFVEALRDRTVKIDIPYVTKLGHELSIYEKDYNDRRVRGKHIAPHTLEVAATWAVLTRLEEPKHHGLTVLQKMKLYNGKTLPGFTTENIEQLRK